MPAKKPAPDIYEHVMQKMGVSAQECLAFEDSENGLRSALQAGLKTLVTISQYTADQDFTGAALVVDKLGDVDQPARSMSGSLYGRHTVDVPLLHRLHCSD